jgi:hypothetical protein
MAATREIIVNNSKEISKQDTAALTIASDESINPYARVQEQGFRWPSDCAPTEILGWIILDPFQRLLAHGTGLGVMRQDFLPIGPSPDN